MIKECTDKRKRILLDFCEKHHHIYIYGAGSFGKKCYNILHSEGILVSGFITTNKEREEYLGISVYSLNDVSVWITEQDGVIPAYLNAVSEEVRKRFNKKKPDVLSLEPQFMDLIEKDIYFFPIIEELRNKFQTIPFKTGNGWKNILVIELDVIGNLICTTPFIRELKRNYPEANIFVVIRKQLESLLKSSPYITRLIPYETDASALDFFEECNKYGETKTKISEFVDTHFKGIHFDAVFFPNEVLCGRNKIDELLLAFYSGADYRIGHLVDADIYRHWIYDTLKDVFSKICYQTTPTHEVLYQLNMLEECGLKVEDDKLELWIDKNSRIQARTILEQEHIKKESRLIAIGLVGRVPAKSWSPENYNQVIHSFHKKYGEYFKFLLFGGQDAVEAAKQLAEDQEVIIDFTGKLTLDVSAACMEYCDMYVGSDTGLLHIATAVGKPSVALYRILDDAPDMCVGGGPVRWGVRRDDSFAFTPPAGLDGCHKICQKKYSHCINQINPQQVEEAMENILRKIDNERIAE